MKQIIITILLSIVVWGAAAQQEQTPDSIYWRKIYVNSELGYPLLPGSLADGTFSSGILSAGPVDIIGQLPKYKIGGIPEQQIWNDKDYFGFYVSLDTLDLEGAKLIYTVDGFPKEKVTYEPGTGRFLFYPDSTDINSFTLSLTAERNDEYAITQNVRIGMVPKEGNMFSYLSDKERKLPDADDFFTLDTLKQGGSDLWLNGEKRDTLYSYSISGVELILNSSKSSSSHDLSMLNDMLNLKELNLYADRVVIESPLHYFSTNVNIYADEIVFESGASISTASTDFKMSGTVNLFARELTAKHQGVLLYRNAMDSVGKFTTNVQGVSATGGNTAFVDNPYAGLSSNWLLQTVGMLNAAFIDQQNEYVKSSCDFYLNQIEKYRKSDYWKEGDKLEMQELDAVASEMKSINSRIRSNYDYFGNPQGFMPMLSFEVNQQLYKQEIDRSLRTLYFTYWMKNSNAKTENRIAACKEAVKQEKEQLVSNIQKSNELTATSKMLQTSMGELVTEMDALTVQLDKKTEELAAEAKENVERYNRINLAKKIIGPIIKIAGNIGGSLLTTKISTVQAADTSGGFKPNVNLNGMGDKLSALSDGIFDLVNPPLDQTYAGNPPYEAFYNTLKSDGGNFANSVDSYSTMLNNIKMDDLGSRGGIMAIGENFKAASESMVNTISKFENAASKTNISNDQIQTELNSLMAKSPEYSGLVSKVEDLNKKKESVFTQLTSTFNDLTTTVYEIQKGIVTIDALSNTAFGQELKKDFKTMLYIDNMEKNAQNRLLKSHYYMGRSYEYTFLEPYDITLNTNKLFEKCKDIGVAANGTLSENDFNLLKEVYTKDLATVEDKIIERFNNNSVPTTKTIYYTLTPEQLAAMNTDSTNVVINLFEDGKFPLSETDIRITNVSVKTMDIDVTGTTIDPDRYFDLSVVHEGNSRFIKENKILGFTHKNQNDIKPVKWSFRCFQNREIDQEELSPSNTSLLNSLFTKAVKDESVFAKPGAWAYLTIERKNEYNANDMDINIKQLQFQISYEAMTSSLNSIAFISASNGLKPDIQLNINGKPSLVTKGFYAKVMDHKYDGLTLIAPETFGEWQFSGWVDQNGKSLSTKAGYDAGYINNNSYFKAVYVKTAAELSVDTLLEVPMEKGYLQLQVTNKGSENLIWSASCDSTWVKIKAGKGGVNDGTIWLEFDGNLPSDPKRQATLKITSNGGNRDVIITQDGKEVSTGIEDVEAGQEQLTVYMRENGFCQVNIGHPAADVRVVVYDMVGRTMKQLSLRDVRTFDLDLSNLSKGLYIFNITYDGKTESRKVMR